MTSGTDTAAPLFALSASERFKRTTSDFMSFPSHARYVDGGLTAKSSASEKPLPLYSIRFKETSESHQPWDSDDFNKMKGASPEEFNRSKKPPRFRGPSASVPLSRCRPRYDSSTLKRSLSVKLPKRTKEMESEWSEHLPPVPKPMTCLQGRSDVVAVLKGPASLWARRIE